MEPLVSVCFDDRAGQTFAPLLLPFHDRKLHIVHPEKNNFQMKKELHILKIHATNFTKIIETLTFKFLGQQILCNPG